MYTLPDVSATGGLYGSTGQVSYLFFFFEVSMTVYKTTSISLPSLKSGCEGNGTKHLGDGDNPKSILAQQLQGAS